MKNWEAILLGVLQGVTEFLPVSSSGHLALARAGLGFEPGGGALFEVFLHVATGLAIVTVFWSEIRELALAPFQRAGGGPTAEAARARSRGRLGLLMISAIPAGVIGLSLRSHIEALFDRVPLVGLFLMGTGLILFLSAWIRPGVAPVGFRGAVVMGLAQAVALLPGISRSGSTIVAGLAAKCDRAEVGRFAFLMGLIPIFGAACLEMLHAGEQAGPGWLPILLGSAMAYVTGVLSLKLLLGLVARGRLVYFAPYCFALGVLALVVG